MEKKNAKNETFNTAMTYGQYVNSVTKFKLNAHLPIQLAISHFRLTMMKNCEKQVKGGSQSGRKPGRQQCEINAAHFRIFVIVCAI